MQHLYTVAALLLVVASISYTQAASIAYFGDVEIYSNETIWKCDKIYCPIEAFRCEVTKQKLETDTTLVKRTNTCYSQDDTVLQQVVLNEEAAASERINLKVSAERNGGISSSSIGGVASTLTPEQQRDLELHLDQINCNIEQNIQNINRGVERQMAELERRLSMNLGNLFGWN